MADAAPADPPETADTAEEVPLLACVGVSKAFGAVRALYQVDFEVRRGEVMALVGDNGAGKSTLIKCIAGIHGHDSGEIFFMVGGDRARLPPGLSRENCPFGEHSNRPAPQRRPRRGGRPPSPRDQLVSPPEDPCLHVSASGPAERQ